MAEPMEQLYQQVILDHSRERHGAGELPAYDAESFQVNPTCGDQVRLRLRLAHDATGPRLAELGWVGQGCSISLASLSVLHDLTTDRTVRELDTLNETFRELMHGRGAGLSEEKQDLLGDATAFTGVAKFPARIKCALLGWMALRDALAHALTSEPTRNPDKENDR